MEIVEVDNALGVAPVRLDTRYVVELVADGDAAQYAVSSYSRGAPDRFFEKGHNPAPTGSL